ncbi:MAG TPA: ABC transporter ATP-binding protein [Acidimicrobiales bacterium]|jgi:iron(III) transport system ATP-binding protein|nr:ABC transporter ATP-binding protein [Acidimicrobiales bacterium]
MSEEPIMKNSIDREVKGDVAVKIEGLHKSYGEKRVLKGIDLSIDHGQFLVLLGPSGSGKTTLLRCIAGIEQISSGHLAIEGTTVGDGQVHVAPERRDLAMVFQDYALWPHMTVSENVGFALRRLRLSRGEAARRCQDLLDRVGLGKFGSRYPNVLSGGEQQRVALARALVAQPRLIVFDEPLSNLDADLRERMRVEIATLAREISATCVYITHDQSEAFALADRVGVLRKGKLAQLGRPEDVYSAPVSPFVAQFTGLAGELRGEVTETGSAPAQGILTNTSDEVAVRLTGVGESARVLARGQSATKRGELVRVLVRHGAVRLCSPLSGDAQFRAKVLDCAFRGRGYEHALILSDGTTFHGVFAEERSERGENVGVQLEAKGCFAFSESQFESNEEVEGTVSHLSPPNEAELLNHAPIEMRA